MAQNVINNKMVAQARAKRMTTFVQGVFFVLGFATFVIGVLGLASTALGTVFFDAKDTLQTIGGIMLIVFGLFTLQIVKIPILYSDTRKGLGGISRGVSSLQSYLTGLSFAAGWSPCIGPFLGAILTMSATAGGLGQSLVLLTAYTLGLGIPFLLVALLADSITPVLSKIKRNMRLIEIISGLLLIMVGVAMLGGQIERLSQYFAAFDFGLETRILGDSDGAAPSVIVAALAGLLSFVSPCVLPLVPAYLSYIGGWAVNNAD